jgi:hypothetical protein
MHKIQQVLVAESWKCEFQKLGWEIRENHDLKTDFTDDLSRIWMINSLGKYNVSFSMNLELSITFKWALNPLNSIKSSVILVLLLHSLNWKAFRWLIAYRFLKQSVSFTLFSLCKSQMQTSMQSYHTGVKFHLTDISHSKLK